MSNSLPPEVATFTPVELEPSQDGIQETQKLNKRLIKLNIEDIEWRLDSRKKFGWIFLGLLLFQNLAVFFLVFNAFYTEKLASLEIVFSTLVSATLVETILVVKIIIEWLFRDINYSSLNAQDLNKTKK